MQTTGTPSSSLPTVKVRRLVTVYVLSKVSSTRGFPGNKQKNTEWGQEDLRLLCPAASCPSSSADGDAGLNLQPPQGSWIHHLRHERTSRGPIASQRHHDNASD